MPLGEVGKRDNSPSSEHGQAGVESVLGLAMLRDTLEKRGPNQGTIPPVQKT